MRKSLTTKATAVAVGAGLALTGLVMVAGPASATGSGATTATFSIIGGTLGISVPATVALNTGTVNTGASSASGQLGAVTVTDTRGLLSNAWTAGVTTTTFTTGTSTTSETVAQSDIAYTSGPSTATSGLGTFVPTVGAPATIGATGITGASWTGLAGNDSATWDPTITFTFLSSQVAGTYTGTITHSVA